MPIIDIFSKRQAALRGETPDVYSYDSMPRELRVQIIYILRDILGSEDDYRAANSDSGLPQDVKINYDEITDTLRYKYGKFRLSENYEWHESKADDLVNFVLREKNIARILDVVELSCRMIGKRRMNSDGRIIDAAKIEEEFNNRFKEHGIGCCFTDDGQIIRIDSEYIHSEVVRPALRILGRRQYEGAREEFLKAHEHHRNGNAKEALNECLKSLESVMKSICDKRGWLYDERATASKLIDICFKNDLVPSFWQSQFDALRSVLKSGAPTARNKLGGHGQGATPKPVPGYVAAYALHMTAAAIVFLADAEASSGAS